MITILSIVSFVALGLLIGTLFRVKTLQNLLASRDAELVQSQTDSEAEIRRIHETAAAETRRVKEAEQELRKYYDSEALRVQTEAGLSIKRAEQLLNQELDKTRANMEARLVRAQQLVDEQRLQLSQEGDRIRHHYEAEAQKAWEETSARLQEAERKVKALQKFEGFVNAEAEIEQLLTQAIAEGNALREQGESVLATAKTLSDQERAKAAQEAKMKEAEAEALLYQATQEAGRILAEAEKRAQAIAGEAYVALSEKHDLENALQAIRNAIDGYGDRYIAPTRNLLDELAEDFGHTTAGEALKTARAISKRMVENGEAATCEYLDESRRETAIRFVTDAFNGHVDAILSRTRHDNHGTLAQEIRDTAHLVNLNGQAFRNVRIMPAYIEARLLELKYGTIVQELKLQDREEQRRLREQIREEEKARRDYERAMREAEKEEGMLRRLMARAQLASAEATAAEKSRYEQQIQELSGKLQEAEERNKRAISMAQQTKRGHVYIISNIGSYGEHVYKIGLTRRLEPQDRIRELGDSSVPFEFDVHALIFSEDAPALEAKLHNHFLTMQVNKVNHRKEFFRVDLKHIRDEIESMGIKASFTMTAEAAEYRESQAIDRAIELNPAARDEWVKRQLQLELIPPAESGGDDPENMRAEVSSAQLFSEQERKVGI